MPTQTGPAALDARRTVRRRVLAATPWAVALLIAALGLTRFAVGAGPALAEERIDLPMAPTAPPAPPAPLEAVDAGEPRSAPVLPPEVTAAVLGAARNALSTDGRGAASPAGDGPRRWALDLAVVEVSQPAPGRLVAVVHGTVITSQQGQGWSAPAPAAVAVGISTLGPPTVGPAWPLATPSTGLAPRGALGGSPVIDELVHQEVLEALLDAGWSPDRVTSVHALLEGLLLARVDGVAPDGTPGERGVWLIRGATGLQVAGRAAPASHTPPSSQTDHAPAYPGPAQDLPEQDPTAHTSETT